MKQFKVRILCCVVLPFAVITAFSKTYYISNNGNDSNDGLSPATPWKTLAQAITKISGGDSVLLRKGDIFREKADFTTAGLTGLYIGSYGTADALPVISGSIVLTGFVPWKNNIYVASCNQNIQYLYMNNQLMTIARYPNRGWLRIQSAVYSGGNTAISAVGLNVSPRNVADYWKGANMRWRRWSWWFEVHTVTGSDADGKFYLSGNPAGSDNVTGWGFYLDNKLSELDTAGEWFYDRTAGKVYIYVPAGTNVNNVLVEASLLDVGMRVSGSRVKDLCFRHHTNTGLNITGQCEVSGCRFEWIGSDLGGEALQATWDVRNAYIHHNYFINNLNNTISWNEDPSHGGSSILEYNHFINCGVVPGYGGTGSWHASGVVIINARNMHVRYNKFDHTGYAAVIVGKPDNFVEYNVIRRAMSTLNDGAAVYTNCDRTTIVGNIILDTEGDLESSGPWSNLGHGIWPEFLGNYRQTVIENNTVANSGAFGLFLPKNFECTVRNNTFYNNKRSQMDLSGDASAGPQNHLIENNILFATGNQMSLSFQQGIDYGTVRNNFIGNPWNVVEVNKSYAVEQWNYMYSWVKGGNVTDSLKVPLYRSYNLQEEMITDPGFDNGISPWVPDASSKPVTVQVVTDQPLMNGKCMKLSYGPGRIVLNSCLGKSLKKGQFYDFRFDYLFQQLDVSTTSPATSYLNVSITDSATKTNLCFFTVPASLKKRRAWMVFYSPVEVTNIKIQLSHTSTISNVMWIDNLSLKPCDAQDRNVDMESKLLYNDTTFARKFSAGPGKWHDVYGRKITDSILLQPFTSIILVRNEEDSIGGLPPALTLFEERFSRPPGTMDAWPNPFSHVLTLGNLEGNGIIRVFSSSGNLVDCKTYSADTIILNTENYPEGLFIVVVYPVNGVPQRIKVVKD